MNSVNARVTNMESKAVHSLSDGDIVAPMRRSSWENHRVPEYPIWFVLLASDSNRRHGGRRSNLEGVRPRDILHLQCESHKYWFGCGWHKCLYGIWRSGVYSWIQLQTGQWTI